MSSQNLRTNQLGKKKNGERTRRSTNSTTTRESRGNVDRPSSSGPCLGLRPKRRRLRIDSADSRDSMSVVYDKKAKDVVGVKEETGDSHKDETSNLNNKNRRKKPKTTKRLSLSSNTSSSTNSSQNTSAYGDGHIVKAEPIVTKTDNDNGENDNSKNDDNDDSHICEIINTGECGREEKRSTSLQFKSVEKSSSTFEDSSSKNGTDNNKEAQRKTEESDEERNLRETTTSRAPSLEENISQESGEQCLMGPPPPPRQTTHRERKWNNKWKLDFPWLEHGVNHNGREVGMCLWCRRAGKKNSFANDGSTNLQYSAFQRHQTNREHRHAALEKQILKQEVGTEKTGKSVKTEQQRASSSTPSTKQGQPTQKEIIIKRESDTPPQTTSSEFLNLKNPSRPARIQAPHQSTAQSGYSCPPSFSFCHQENRPRAPLSYATVFNNDYFKRTRFSRVVNSVNDDDDDDQKTSTAPQRIFLLSKKAPLLELSGDLLILQEGLESWTTSSGISSLIESLEGCSAATTTTSTASSRAIVSEELPSFSSTSIKSPTPFKKAYVESEHADGILKSLSWLWRTNKLCDAVICSGETKIMLHRLILFAVSPHLLEKNIRDGAELEVNLPAGISDEALATFVAFLYDGVLNLTEYNYKDIERVGNLLKVEKVQRYCREFASSLAEYKLHQPLPIPITPIMEGGNHEYVGKRKRGRPSKQTVVLNLGDDHSLADRLDPSHYLQSADLSNYHSMALSGPTISRMNSDMPVVFPDSQEYCLPSTSQTSQLFSANQGHVKTEPYQQSPEFCSPFSVNPKSSKSNSKEDADHISSFVSQETSRKSSSTVDIQTTSNNNNDNGDDDDNLTTANTKNSNNEDNGKKSTTERNSSNKSGAKSFGSPSPKGDGGPSETLQSTSYPTNVVASSGDGFSIYSLSSS